MQRLQKEFILKYIGVNGSVVFTPLVFNGGKIACVGLGSVKIKVPSLSDVF